MNGMFLAVLVSLSLRPAGAIEIPTAETSDQRGTVGYVDMQKVFKAYPGTVRAKENFEELVRQAEEQVNLRKAEVLRLRNELSDLKIQRDFIAKTPIVVSTPTASAETSSGTAPPKPAAAPNPFEFNKPVVPGPSPLAPPAVSNLAPKPFSLPGLDKPFVDTPKPEPLVINIPGVSTAPIVVQPPAGAPKKPEPLVISIPGVSTAPIVVQPPATVAKSSAPLAVALSSAAPVNPALAELDVKIALKTLDFNKKDAAYKDFQATQEKILLDLESRRTEILLGKINKAIQDVAHESGISVVVDKSSIVFGHGAVDLTEKVLARLKEKSP